MPGCTNCHLRGEFGRATSASSHGSVACKSCHGGTTPASRVRFGTSAVFSMWMGVSDADPSLAVVPADRCISCHAEVMDRTSESAGLRIAHATCALTRECGECHSTVAHGGASAWPRTSTMEMCFDCHGKSGAPDECDVCHAARLPSDRIQSSTFAVTHGPNYLRTHGMGRMSTCSACHEARKCAKCHGTGIPHEHGFVNAHGPSALSKQARCTDCHLKRFCSECHGYAMPHTRRFLLGHASTVKKDGEDGCRRCHADPDCSACHVKHIHPVDAEQIERLGIGEDGTTP